MFVGALIAMLAALVLGSCAPARAPAQPSHASFVSPLGRDHPLAGRIWDVRARAFVSEEALFNALAAATFVGLGEQHDNADHHLLQAHAIDALTSRGRAPTVVFEMLDRHDDDAVARARREHPRDPDAVSVAVDWAHSGWPPWSLYRPIFVAAVTRDLPLYAGGIDRKAAMQLAMEGPSAVPPELVRDYGLDVALPGPLEASLRAEMRDAHCGLLPDSMLDSMVFVQRVRDATLANGLARAGAERGAVLIAGNGHVRRDRGVPAVLARRSPARFAAVGILEVRNGWTKPLDYAAAFDATELPFDYVYFTPRASDADHCADIAAHRQSAGTHQPAQ